MTNSTLGYQRVVEVELIGLVTWLKLNSQVLQGRRVTNEGRTIWTFAYSETTDSLLASWQNKTPRERDLERFLSLGIDEYGCAAALSIAPKNSVLEVI